MNRTVEKDTNYYLELFITDKFGEPQTGLAVNYKIIKSSDNSVVQTGSLTDLGDGVYKNSYTFTTVGQYRIIYDTPSGYTDEMEVIQVIEKLAKESELLKILGLVHHNYRLYNCIYNGRNMTYAIARLYATKSDTENNINHIAEYEIKATYNGQSLMTNYTMVQL